MPKELLGEQDSPLPKADIFSLGCSIYELARCIPLPKGGHEWAEMREGKIRLPPSFSPTFVQLIEVYIFFFL